MSKKKIEFKENYIDLYADKIWDRTSLINPKTGRFYDEYIPTIYALYKALDRFIEAQDKYNTYQTALEEVKAGRKRTHWIWYIFPQMQGLGTSEMSKFYGINGRDEATQYINHPVLRDRLVEITEAVYNSDKTVYEIFGNDAIKVRSCMLLFASVSDIPIFKKMIHKYSWK
jgi:uncharacterized protein (DUF1810 family)